MRRIPAIFLSKYFYLLLALIANLLVRPLLADQETSSFLVNILFSFLVVFCINLNTKNKVILIAASFLGVSSLFSYWVVRYLPDRFMLFEFHHIALLLFLILVTVSVAYSISQHKKVTEDTLLGAVCGYLLLGITWAEVYVLTISANLHSFSNNALAYAIPSQMQHFIYYSFETLTTLGYGDILPLSSFARTFSWMEAVSGQIYLAVWISQLVGLRIAQGMRNK